MRGAAPDFARVVSLLLAGISMAAALWAEPRVELYTAGPGDVLFQKFGHAAVCVVDDATGASACYNYGTADFSDPIRLSWDVVQGEARFWVSVSDLRAMLTDFVSQDRTVYRQTLRLPADQRERLVEALTTSATLENREYVYNHFSENCATRPRDLIDAISGGALARLTTTAPRSYRDYMLEGIAADWSLVLVSDLFLGRMLDQPRTRYQGMFFPRELRESVAEALGASPEVVYQRRGASLETNARRTRNLLTAGLVLLAAVSGVLAFRFAWARRLAIAVFGSLGLVLVVLSVVSPMPELNVNEMLFVFLPTDFVLLAASPLARSAYTKLRLLELGLVAVLIVVGALIQPLWGMWAVAVATMAAVLTSSAIHAS